MSTLPPTVARAPSARPRIPRARWWAGAIPAHLVAAGVFLLLAGLLTWPRLLHATTSVVDTGDPLWTIWSLDWINYALARDPGRLYAAPIYYGFPLPLAYDDIFIGPALLVGLLTPLTGSLLLTYNLLIIGSFALNGWAAYALARRVLGSATGGVVAGMVYSFWSYTFAHLSHLNSLALYPIPLALLCLHQAFTGLTPTDGRAPARGRVTVGWVAAFTACFLWQMLCSFYYAAYLGMAAGGLLLWEALVVRRWRGWTGRQRGGMIGLLGAALALSGAVLAGLSQPYLAVQRELGFYRSPDEQTVWSAQPLDYLSVSPRNRTYRYLLPNEWPEPLFPGFAVLALGAVGAGLTLARRGPATAAGSGRGFYLALAAGAFVLSLGPVLALDGVTVPLPYSLLSNLPGFNALRAPGRLAMLAALGWGVLAGAGWLALTRRLGTVRWGAWGAARLRGLATLALLGVLCAEQWTVLTPVTPVPAPAAFPAVYQWLAARPDGGVVAEFPASVGLSEPWRFSKQLYYQTLHRHPLMNGHTSFLPPTYVEMVRYLDADVAITPADIGILQSLDVRYLVFDRLAYKNRHWAMIQDNLARFPAARFAATWGDEFAGGNMVYTLDPMPAAGRLRLAATLPPQVPPAAGVPVTLTVTNPYTYPLLARLDPQLGVEWGWAPQAAEGAARTVPNWQRARLDLPLTVEPGTHSRALAIPAPERPGRYQLEVRLPRAFPRYTLAAPPQIVVGP